MLVSNQEVIRPFFLMGLKEKPAINKSTRDEILSGGDSSCLNHPYLSDESLQGVLGKASERETGVLLEGRVGF